MVEQLVNLLEGLGLNLLRFVLDESDIHLDIASSYKVICPLTHRFCHLYVEEMMQSREALFNLCNNYFKILS